MNRSFTSMVIVWACLTSVATAQLPRESVPPAATYPAGGNPSQPPSVYTTPYTAPTVEQIGEVIGRIRSYLEVANPARAIDSQTRQEITDFSTPNPNAVHDRGERNVFPLIQYEWGVTYASMIHAAEVTGDAKYADFVAKRYQLIHNLLPVARAQLAANPDGRGVMFRSLLAPRSLDDSGAMCASMIKARRANVGPDMLPFINGYIEHISNKQQRLSDGTLARRSPQPETLWLDDMYMSIPALAQMGALTGERKYFDDAAKQVLQFSSRMFNKQRGLYMHGWSSNSPEHPEFYWARANGWAMVAMIELLDVMPEDHADRSAVIDQLRAHIKGVTALQSGEGRWHNLMDRNDSYLETSATSMFVYSIAKAVNRGWVTGVSYAPAALLGWNAVAQQVNSQGQVEQTCVGTSLAFDPAYYYHRPRSVYALHGYGPTIHAGAEMIRLFKSDKYTVGRENQFRPKEPAR